MINKYIFQDFFVLRMVEMMHKDTLDSYRVRTNNVMSILKELSEVLRNWRDGNIKRFITVQSCIEECITLLQEDDGLVYPEYTKNLFLADLNTFISNSNDSKHKDIPLKDESNALIYFIEECISQNQKKYLFKLIEKIKSFVFTKYEYDNNDFMPRLTAFYKILNAFGCELINKGYSKKYLYLFFLSFKNNQLGKSFEEAFSEMEHKLTSLRKQDFTVVIQVSFPSEKMAITAERQCTEIKDIIPINLRNNITRQRNYFKTNKFLRYYILNIKAFDRSSAASSCYAQLSDYLDKNQDIIRDATIANYSLVFSLNPNGSYRVTPERYFILDNGGQDTDNTNSTFNNAIGKILKSKTVEDDVKDRIVSSLRHLRIGDSQIEIEQQFINYWIALEFLFSSSVKGESTIERIKDYLIRILCVCYTKRNALYLKHWFIRVQFLKEDDSIYDYVNDDVVNTINNALEKYRAKKLKSHLRSKDAVRKYVMAHRIHLQQHITRIYRLRNELVHEAAIKQNIMSVTSNLRFYLVFVLNQLIGFFSGENTHQTPKTMHQFFWFYQKWERTMAELNPKDGALSVPLAKNYIN